MSKTGPLSIRQALAGVRFLAKRTPATTPAESAGAFASLAAYRDGAIYVGHYAGDSAWERHPADEIVMVIEGSTTLFLLEDGVERAHALGAGELIVVPESTWHRFETPDGVKVLSVTPEPSDHTGERPA